MCVASHTIHAHRRHFGWDNAIPPVETAAPGTTLTFSRRDGSAGQLIRESTAESVRALDFGKVNPVSGPVFVDGAEPGDVLKATVEGFAPSGFGWTANIPGFGLLADLRVSETADQPNWVVSFYFPRAVLA